MSKPKASSQQLIQFNNLIVNGVDSTSGIFIGTNSQSGWNTMDKENFGLGRVHGSYIKIPNNKNIVYDQDFIDTIIHDQQRIVDKRKQVQ